MKFINILNLILIAVLNSVTVFPAKAQLNSSVNPFLVEKIEIKAINPGITGVGNVSYDRQYFDDVFESLSGMETTVQWNLNSNDEIFMFSLLINECIPYNKEDIQIYPIEIYTNYSNTNWKYGSYNSSQTNDPIGTKIKLTFTYKNGTIEYMFASDHSIDISNYRYYLTEPLKKYFELKYVELGIYSANWLDWLNKK